MFLIGHDQGHKVWVYLKAIPWDTVKWWAASFLPYLMAASFPMAPPTPLPPLKSWAPQIPFLTCLCLMAAPRYSCPLPQNLVKIFLDSPNPITNFSSLPLDELSCSSHGFHHPWCRMLLYLGLFGCRYVLGVFFFLMRWALSKVRDWKKWDSSAPSGTLVNVLQLDLNKERKRKCPYL